MAHNEIRITNIPPSRHTFLPDYNWKQRNYCFVCGKDLRACGIWCCISGRTDACGFDCWPAEDDCGPGPLLGSTCVGLMGRWYRPPPAKGVGWACAEALAAVLWWCEAPDLATEAAVTVSLVWRSILISGFAPAKVGGATLPDPDFIRCVSSAPIIQQTSLKFTEVNCCEQSLQLEVPVFSLKGQSSHCHTFILWVANHMPGAQAPTAN